MRRSDREILDRNGIAGILSSAKVIRIAFSTGGVPYIVPLSFGYEWEGMLPVFYLHSAMEGRKIDLMKEDPSVGFELDVLDGISGRETGCSYTAYYSSVIGSGRLEEVVDADEKRRGLQTILVHQAGKPFPIPDNALSSVLVLKLSAEEMSAKSHRK